MKHDDIQQEDSLSFADMVRMKNNARNKLIRAVSEADKAALDLAARYVKAALRGNSVSIARPRRFSSL